MIYPAQLELFLRRQGWRNFDTDEIETIEDDSTYNLVRKFPSWHWICPESFSSRWIILVAPVTDPNWRNRYKEAIDRLAHLYSCETWELECVIRCEPCSEIHDEIIEIYDQMTGLDPIESPDHQPVQICCNKDGANKLIAALISHRYGWGSTVSAIGRGGGVFDITIEDEFAKGLVWGPSLRRDAKVLTLADTGILDVIALDEYSEDTPEVQILRSRCIQNRHQLRRVCGYAAAFDENHTGIEMANWILRRLEYRQTVSRKVGGRGKQVRFWKTVDLNPGDRNLVEAALAVKWEATETIQDRSLIP